MRFKSGDTVICIEAPWHNLMARVCCQFTDYGPKKDEEVTIERYCPGDHRYLLIKEYPALDTFNFYGYHEALFEKLVSDEQLCEDLKGILVR